MVIIIIIQLVMTTINIIFFCALNKPYVTEVFSKLTI